MTRNDADDLRQLKVQLDRERMARNRSDERLATFLATSAMRMHAQFEHKESLKKIEWVASVIAEALQSPPWWGLMPSGLHRRKLMARLRRKGLFDGSAYLRRYPDVDKAGMDPLLHYIKFGRHEGREI